MLNFEDDAMVPARHSGAGMLSPMLGMHSFTPAIAAAPLASLLGDGTGLGVGLILKICQNL